MIKYICNSCGCGNCILEVQDDASIPEWCPYDRTQTSNWNLIFHEQV